MKFKNMPLIIMLVAGLITSVMTVIKNYDTTVALTTLFIVLLSFYVLGLIARYVINKICFPIEEDKKEEENSEESEGSEEEGQETPQEESSNEDNRDKY